VTCTYGKALRQDMLSLEAVAHSYMRGHRSLCNALRGGDAAQKQQH